MRMDKKTILRMGTTVNSPLIVALLGNLYNVEPPNVISWFMTPPLTMVITTINPSEIVVMFTNLAIDWGPHIAV